jgi:hypothetical protein
MSTERNWIFVGVRGEFIKSLRFAFGEPDGVNMFDT